MKKFYKCAYELQQKILDKSYLGKVYHQGTLRGFFNSKEECENYTKKLPNCKKIITTFNNDDVLKLVKRIKQVLKSKGYIVGRHHVIRYKSDENNRSKAGVDMVSICVSNKENAYNEKIIKDHNIRDFNFAKKNIPYANIFLD